MNRLVPYRAFTARHVRGTSIEKDQPLFAIQDPETGLYFIWSYTDEQFAKRMQNRVKIDSEIDKQCNWRQDLHELVPSDRKAF